MMRNEFVSFQKELYSRNWEDFCGAKPSLDQFKTFNKWKLTELNAGRHETNIAFEDYMLFQRELRSNTWSEIIGSEPTFDDYAAFKRLHTSMAFFFYLGHFRQKPTFGTFLQYERDKKRFNWSELQCPEPTFEDYVKFLVEKDNVSFDWEKAIGRVPRLEEYMLYADTIKGLDADTLALPQFSFRCVLEQGIKNISSDASGGCDKPDSRCRSPSPLPEVRLSPSRRWRSKSPESPGRRSPLRRRTRSPSPFDQRKRLRSRSPGGNRSEAATGYNMVPDIGVAGSTQGVPPHPQPMTNTGTPASSSVGDPFAAIPNDMLKSIVSRFKSTVSHPGGIETQQAPHPTATMQYPSSEPTDPNIATQNLHQSPGFQNYSTPLGQNQFVPPPPQNPPHFEPRGPNVWPRGPPQSGPLWPQGPPLSGPMWPRGAPQRGPIWPRGAPQSHPPDLMSMNMAPHAGPPDVAPNYMEEALGMPVMGLPIPGPNGQGKSNPKHQKQRVRPPRKKKQAMSEVEQQPVQTNVQKNAKKAQVKHTRCALPECRAWHLQGDGALARHLSRCHLTPLIFYKNLPVTLPVKKELLFFIRYLAERKGVKSSLTGIEGAMACAHLLLEKMVNKKIHKCNDECEVSQEDLDLIHSFHKSIGDPLPVAKIDVHKPNCVAALIWWRNVVDLLCSMNAKARMSVKRTWAQPNWNRNADDPNYSKSEKKACVFEGCGFEYFEQEELYNHLGQDHFSKAIFATKEECQTGKKKQLFNFLKHLTKLNKFESDEGGYSGILAQARQLLTLVQENELHICSKECANDGSNMAAVYYFHAIIEDELPVDEIDVHKPNCVASLLWWRNVVAILNYMTPEDRADIKSKFSKPHWTYGTPVSKKQKRKDAWLAKNHLSQIMPGPPQMSNGMKAPDVTDSAYHEAARYVPILFGSDAYLRLDLLKKDEGVSIDDALGEQCDSKVFVYLIAGFENPETLPNETLVEEINVDHRVFTCIGLDPIIGESATDTVFEQVERAVSGVPKVVAIGAVGLDYSKETYDKDGQLVALRRMCEIAKSKKLPMVIDCKEPAESRGALQANRDCIQALQEVFSAEYRFLKKSVASFDEVHIWHEAYPNTIFGINGDILKEDATPSFLSFLSMVDGAHIVLGTNAPFNHPEGKEANSPYTLFDVAEELGNMKGLATSEILASSTKTLVKFFHLRK